MTLAQTNFPVTGDQVAQLPLAITSQANDLLFFFQNGVPFRTDTASLSDTILPIKLNALLKWRAARAKAAAGLADAKVLMIGDSTTAGVQSGSTPEVLGSAPYRLVGMLNSQGKFPASLGLAIPPSSTDTDNRWTPGASWTKTTLGWALNSCYQSASSANSLVFTPAGGFTYDQFDVYFLSYTGSGTATATGGSATPFSGTGGPGSIMKVTVSAGSAATNNAITITQSSGTVYIVGVEPWLSTSKKVRIGVAGVGSSTSTSWNTSFLSQDSLQCIAAYAPDLTIINLGINDNVNNVPPETLVTNIAALANTALLTSNVMIHTMFPSSTPGLEATYVSALKTYAAGINAPIIDFFSSFGGVQPAAFAADSLHPNGAGYVEDASMIFNAISL